jgi:hypothetical protein
VRLVAADAMLLTLAAAPSPVLSSGFCDGLFRAASVASALHPCEHHDDLMNMNHNDAAVSDISFESYGSNSGQQSDYKSILRNHSKKGGNKQDVVLSRRAVEMMLAVTPPPCGRINTAASVSVFMDFRNKETGHVTKRSCIGFEEFARRSDVQQWCKDGWFRLRDLSTAFSHLRAEQY